MAASGTMIRRPVGGFPPFARPLDAARRSRSRATAALALLLSALASAPPLAAATFPVTIVAGHPPAFLWVRHFSETLIPAVDAALEGSGHRIRWSELYGGTLAPVGGELAAIEEGLAEFGFVLSLFNAAELPTQNVSFYTPFVSSDPALVVRVLDALHDRLPEMRAAWETNGLEYLAGGSGDDYALYTNFPVDSVDDLEGRRIGAPGATALWLDGTGAVAVAADLTSYYTDLKTGVYDGVVTFATAALAAKLHEVVPHVTRLGFGAQFTGGLVAARDWFDGLPDAVREALRAGSEAYQETYLADLAATTDAALVTMASEGATIVEASPALRERWANGMTNIAREWAGTLDERGVPGSMVLEAYLEAMREAGATPVRDWDSD